jgi:uncharacterized protein with NRDE domain
MCTVIFSYQQHEEWPLIIAANRDEFYERPTRTMHWWKDNDDILAGLDLKLNGTWFGIHKNGRIATITNHRSFPLLENTPSRGDLVRNFLEGTMSTEKYFETLQETGEAYNGFNLLFGEVNNLWYYSNKISDKSTEEERSNLGEVNPGFHGLSNALLNSSWPKVDNAKNTFSTLFKAPEKLTESLVFDNLKNKHRYKEGLPNTGIGQEKEHVLSSLFIETEGYGTRSSWFLRVSKDGQVEVAEQAYMPSQRSICTFELD